MTSTARARLLCLRSRDRRRTLQARTLNLQQQALRHHLLQSLEKRVAIEVVNRQRLARLDRKAVASLARRTLEAIGRAGASLTVAFVRDHKIRDLNRDYRGLNRATDVLSFPGSD